MQPPSLPPPDSYANIMQFIVDWETAQAEFLAELLWNTYHPDSVIDFGCGPGNYLSPFGERGCTIMGVDLDPTAGGMLTGSQFVRADLRHPFKIPGKHFDLALCIETAEHLQPDYGWQLVENVAHSARRVFWSAAHPGQGGQNHHNEREPESWEAMFKDAGFRIDPQQDEIRAAIAANPECQKVQWLIPNARVFSW